MSGVSSSCTAGVCASSQHALLPVPTGRQLGLGGPCSLSLPLSVSRPPSNLLRSQWLQWRSGLLSLHYMLLLKLHTHTTKEEKQPSTTITSHKSNWTNTFLFNRHINWSLAVIIPEIFEKNDMLSKNPSALMIFIDFILTYLYLHYVQPVFNYVTAENCSHCWYSE